MLNEEAANQKRLNDVVFVQLRLDEQAGLPGGRVKLRGEFARAGTPTANKRVYSERLLAREIKRLSEAFTQRRLFGELDHPSEGGTKLRRVSHVITDLRLENGIVVGEAEILNTDDGRTLKAILEAGCRVGVSSRGYGTTRSNESGEDVVQDDFRLTTFDVVADPADVKAYPGVYNESTDVRDDETPYVAEMAVQDALAAQEVALRSEFASRLIDNLAMLRPLALDEAMEIARKDPRAGGAVAALGKIKDVLLPFILGEDEQGVYARLQADLAAAKAEVERLKGDVEAARVEATETEKLARELGYRLVVERELAGSEDRTIIESMVGDLGTYASCAALKGRIEEARTAVSSRKEREAREREKQAKVEAARRDAEKQRKAAEAELQEERERSRKLSVALYAERKLRNHPDSPRLRKILAEAEPSDERAVDRILESAKSKAPAPEGNLRSRIRENLGRGSSPGPRDAHRSVNESKRRDEVLDTGLSLAEFNQLSGGEPPRRRR